MEAIKPLGGHTVFLLMVQLALLLSAARAGAELCKRVGLPAVVGELASGILLGPSGFGARFPHAFRAVFPLQQVQFQLLDVVGTLGMVLLLLLTGLETDVRLLRNLGRAAFIASLLGMLVPFGSGFALGQVMPAAYVAQPEHRTLFSLFLATAMAISAMPVIAKILLDLRLMRRNIGLIILSAGVVDDTAGWLVLSLIAGAASQGVVHVGDLARTLLAMGGFLAAVAFVLYPLSRWFLGVAARFRVPDSDLVVLVVLSLFCAAATEKIGVHAVFGAFVAGVMFRQVPRLRHQAVQRLESFVFAILAPVFFGIVGLKVDLWSLGGGRMLAVVLAVACLGKFLGVTVGALWGGLRFWEALSIAVAMNARGAMELVVATIGLSLGLLNQQMFSIIVMVAVVTSFMAPLLLRLTMRRVRITEEEEQRILADESVRLFDPAHVRALLPTAGSPDALAAATIGFALGKRSDAALTVLHVVAEPNVWRRVGRAFRRAKPNGIDMHLGKIRDLADGAPAPSTSQRTARAVSDAIVEEASKGYDVLLVGASRTGGNVIEDIVESTPCHLVVVRSSSAGAGGRPFKNVLVPIEGGVFSAAAVELAVRYAETADAKVTLAVLSEHRAPLTSYGEVMPRADEREASVDDQLERISHVFRTSSVKPRVLRLEYNPGRSAVEKEVATGGYDLIVVGAENRAVQHRLFFGYENERLMRKSPATVAIVVPKLARIAHPS